MTALCFGDRQGGRKSTPSGVVQQIVMLYKTGSQLPSILSDIETSNDNTNSKAPIKEEPRQIIGTQGVNAASVVVESRAHVSSSRLEAVVNKALKDREATTSKHVVKANILPRRLDPPSLERQQHGVNKAGKEKRTAGPKVDLTPIIEMVPVHPHHNPNPDTIDVGGVSITIDDFRFLQRTCPPGVTLVE